VNFEGFNILNTQTYHTLESANANIRNVRVADLYLTQVPFGFFIYGHDWIIEDNEIYKLKVNGGDADYLRFHGTGHIIRNNYFHGTLAADVGSSHMDCFQTHSGNTHDILFEGNICLGIGQGIMASDESGQASNSGWIFRNNVLTGGDHSVRTAIVNFDVQDLVVEHNTFVDLKQGVGMKDTPTYPGNADGAVVKNNILYNVQGLAVSIDNPGPNAEGYNLYYNTPGGISTDLKGVDPMFVDYASNDFHLQAGSPACDGGEGGTYVGAFPCGDVDTCSQLGGSCCSNGQDCTGNFEYSSDCGSLCCVGGNCQTAQGNDCEDDLSGVCCSSGQTCSGSMQTTGDCSTCCVSGSCQSQGGNFQPDVILEAEDGEVRNMQIVTGSGAVGSYVITNTAESGSVSFTFDITEPGDYKLEVRVMTPGDSVAHNSFYVGLDDEPVEGDLTKSYDMTDHLSFGWDEVSLRGSSDVWVNEFDPMIWTLSVGEHTFTFYGREPDTRLDQLKLVMITTEPIADIDNDGCIDMEELITYVSLWKDGQVMLSGVLDAVLQWKEGCQ